MTKKGPWGFHDLMVTAAHRYCLGRMTYIVSECVDWLLENWDSFEPSTRKLIRDETREAIRDERAGMECDVDQWERLLRETENR